MSSQERPESHVTTTLLLALAEVSAANELSVQRLTDGVDLLLTSAEDPAIISALNLRPRVRRSAACVGRVDREEEVALIL